MNVDQGYYRLCETSVLNVTSFRIVDGIDPYLGMTACYGEYCPTFVICRLWMQELRIPPFSPKLFPMRSEKRKDGVIWRMHSDRKFGPPVNDGRRFTLLCVHDTNH